MTNNLSVVINADAPQVWTMLREPSKVAQWHGWQAEDLDAEIKEIYFSGDVEESADHTSLTVHGGDVFELHPVTDGTRVSVTRAAMDHDSEWASWDEDITQGWLTFLQQLRFALECLRLVFGVFAGAMDAAGSDIPWSFSLSGWLAVGLLFVLAQVFAEGTRLRTDLDGMV